MNVSEREVGGRRPVRVAVIGGGASGVLTAINLLVRSDDAGLEVVVHEASGVVGRGVAYGTDDRRHLLNVRSRHMSAFPDAPSDLVDWALRTGRSDDPQAFLPRADYASYLQDRLADVADDRLVVRAGRVVDVVRVPDGQPADGGAFEVRTERTSTRADAVVLCHGNQRPRPLEVAGAALPEAPWHLADPWSTSRLRTLPPDAAVLVVGSGLTAVDTAITLLEDGPGRRVTLLSRRGRLPRPHAGQQHTAWVTDLPADADRVDDLQDALERELRAAADRGVGWRAVVDGVRPVTNALWRRLPLEERRRFVGSEQQRAWEVLRHRMAPEVALRLERYRLEGRLSVRSGAVAAVEDLGQRCLATTVDAEGAARAPEVVDAVVNCTGPLGDLRGTADPLLRSLLRRGLIAPDPLALGLDATEDGRVRDARGATVEGLHVVGPPRRGTLWETTAIPEIRAQAAQVAAAVVADLAVGAVVGAGASSRRGRAD